MLAGLLLGRAGYDKHGHNQAFFSLSSSFFLFFFSLLCVFWVRKRRKARMLAFTLLLSGICAGFLIVSLDALRANLTMQGDPALLLGKKHLYEGVLLEPLLARPLPPYRYALPERRSTSRPSSPSTRHNTPSNRPSSPSTRHHNPPAITTHQPIRHHDLCGHPKDGDPAEEMGGQRWMARGIFLLRRISTDHGRSWMPLYEKILLTAAGEITQARGQWLRVELKLRRPRRYANPGQPDPWAAFAREGMRYQGSSKAERLVALGASPHSSSHLVDTLRESARHWLHQQIPEAQARGLMGALLLGDRSGIDEEMRESFARTGTSHLLAISGLHLALVSGVLFGALLWCFGSLAYLLLWVDARRLAALVTWPLAGGYVLLSGSAISTQRAYLMISLVLCGTLLLRRPEGITTLAWAACLLLAFDPQALATASFLLSFGAVFLLMTLAQAWDAPPPSKPLEQIASPSPPKSTKPSRFTKIARGLALSLWSSALVILGTLPISLGFSPYLPLHAPLVNLIAIPLCGFFCVSLGLLGIALAPILPSIAAWVMEIARYAALGLLALIKTSAQLDLFILQLPPLRSWEITGLLLALLALYLLRSPRPALRRLCALASLLCFLLPPAFTTWQQKTQPTLTLDFIDIGQGDATLIRFPNGYTMLIDAGGEAFAPIDTGERSILPYLRHQRIKRLDTAVLSHPHPDHFGGFLTLFQKLPIGELWHTGRIGGHPHYPLFEAIRRKKKIPLRRPHQIKPHHIGGVRVQILHPFPQRYEGENSYWALHANDNSLVILMTYKKIRILLTGDIEERAEEILTERYPHLRADLLKVPHHGSRTSSTALFLDHLRPRHAVVSLGRQNLFGFPHPSTTKRYQERKIPLWRTDQHGLLRVTTDGHSLRFQSTLRPP
jgi:competence protein ComEC